MRSLSEASPLPRTPAEALDTGLSRLPSAPSIERIREEFRLLVAVLYADLLKR